MLKEDNVRVALHCRVTPETMRTIDGMIAIQGESGRKIDILATEYRRMRSSNGRKSATETTKFTETRELLSDPDIFKWPIRRVAKYLHCSKSWVAYVKQRMILERAN